MTLKSANLDSPCLMGEQQCGEPRDTNSPVRLGSTRRSTSRGLLLRKGVWHIEGEASFAFWNAVDPSMEAPGETSCFARSRKQMERFTVVRNTYNKGLTCSLYRAIP
jgi:hypothetical protein